jgi:hypothetical protein
MFPKLPLPPFIGKPKRNHSAWSSTACGTPTPHSDMPQDSPTSVSELRLPVNARGVDVLSPVMDSPRIQRSAVVGLGPELVLAEVSTVPPTPACGRLYEYRAPPIPKTDSIYKLAKKAEYEGNIAKAMELYLVAIEKKDRPDSAIKDYAGLLHMRGKTQEAIDFLENSSRTDLIKNTAGLKNLLEQLRSFVDSQTNDLARRDLPRLLYVTMDEGFQVHISEATLPSLFPNYLKVSRIFYVNPLLDDEGCPFAHRALVEFASHSAARKALMVNKHSSLRCAWASERLLDCDSRIVKMAGNEVKTLYAIVPEDVVFDKWPKLLQTKPSTSDPDHIDEPVAHRPLQLPVMKRGDVRPIELDIACIEASVDSILHEMHWCLDTPSPIRTVACLL